MRWRLNRRRRYSGVDADAGDTYDTCACRDTRSRDRDRSEYRVSVRDRILCMLKNIIVLLVKKAVKIAQIATSSEWYRIGAMDDFTQY